MTRHRTLLVGLAATAALVAASCGGVDDTTAAAPETPASTETAGPTPSPSPSPTDDARDTAQTLTAYFEGFDALSEEGAQQMAANASPGSPAALYAGYTGAGLRSFAGFESETRVEGESAVSTTTAQDGSVSTTTYSGFEFDDDGLLVTWTSDPGGPLASRVVQMDRTIQRNGLTVEFSYAYEATRGILAMPVRVVNNRADSGEVTVYTYLQPSGEQLEGRTSGATTTPFFVEVEGGAFLFDTIYVEGGELGGTALLEFDNDVENPERVQVPSTPGSA